MAKHLAIILLVLAVLQSYANAQFNIIPVSVAESVVEEHKQKEKERTEELQKTHNPEESPVIIPLHPHVAAGLRLQDENAAEIADSTNEAIPHEQPRIKREDVLTRTRVSGVERSASRNADIDSFLSELEGDIARTQPKRYNAHSVDSAPSWSYKPQSQPTTQTSFWKKWGDSLSSTYTQVKNKAKDITKGLQS